MHAYTTGESFKSAEVVLTPPGGKGKFVELDLANVVVTSWQVSDSPSNGRPVESDTFAFSSVQAKFWTSTSRGTQRRSYSTGWDFRLNQPLDPPTPVGPVGSSSGPHQIANVPAAHRVKGSHKAMSAHVNHHRVATHTVSGTQFSRPRWISAVAKSTATEYPV
jgi:hypothetical protein